MKLYHLAINPFFGPNLTPREPMMNDNIRVGMGGGEGGGEGLGGGVGGEELAIGIHILTILT